MTRDEKSQLAERIAQNTRHDEATGCLLWTGYKCGRNGGYGRTRFWQKRQLVHRLAWQMEHGPIPDGMCVCHKCDTPLCVNVDHLFLGTQQENTADKVKKGRNARTLGETSGRAKVTSEQVIQMRKRRAAGETPESIANDFGLSQGHVSAICNGKKWPHLPLVQS